MKRITTPGSRCTSAKSARMANLISSGGPRSGCRRNPGVIDLSRACLRLEWRRQGNVRPGRGQAHLDLRKPLEAIVSPLPFDGERGSGSFQRGGWATVDTVQASTDFRQPMARGRIHTHAAPNLSMVFTCTVACQPHPEHRVGSRCLLEALATAVATAVSNARRWSTCATWRTRPLRRSSPPSRRARYTSGRESC